MAAWPPSQGRPLPAGFVDVETDNGLVYVNPSQVAYVRDEPEMPQVDATRHTLSGLEGRQARGRL